MQNHHPKFPDYVEGEKSLGKVQTDHLTVSERCLLNALIHVHRWHDQLRAHDIEMMQDVIADAFKPGE